MIFKEKSTPIHHSFWGLGVAIPDPQLSGPTILEKDKRFQQLTLDWDLTQNPFKFSISNCPFPCQFLSSTPLLPLFKAAVPILFGNRHWFHESFPGGASGKEPTSQSRRCQGHGFDPWVRKIPWRGAWQPTPVLLPGESHGQRSLVGYSPQGRKESGTNVAT